MYDVTAIGELLIDFTPEGTTPEGAALYGRNPGGGPPNVLSAVARLGGRTALISKVGDDRFGKFLISVMKDVSVETRGIRVTDKANTTLAFVHLDSSGDRSFSFCRKPGADMLLSDKDVDRELVAEARVFHFSTVSMTHEPSRSATLYAVRIAKENGALISFDPNLRPPLWDGLEEARQMIIKGLGYADVLKVSEEELEFITGIKGLGEGAECIAEKYGIHLILVTLGAKGCFYRLGTQTGRLDTYDVKTIDTTGAGDTFLGAFLYKWLEWSRNSKSIRELGREEVERMVDFANAAGSLATTKKGAIPAMPSASEIEACIRNVKKLGHC